jgi:hypothetical protein
MKIVIGFFHNLVDGIFDRKSALHPQLSVISSINRKEKNMAKKKVTKKKTKKKKTAKKKK